MAGSGRQQEDHADLLDDLLRARARLGRELALVAEWIVSAKAILAGEPPTRPTLHSEMARVLHDNQNRWMTFQQVASAIGRANRYQPDNDVPVTPEDIQERAALFDSWFEHFRDRLRCREPVVGDALLPRLALFNRPGPSRLREYLDALETSNITVTFEEVTAITGDHLPPRSGLWDEGGQGIEEIFRRYGRIGSYVLEDVDIQERWFRFRRDRGGRPSSPEREPREPHPPQLGGSEQKPLPTQDDPKEARDS